jgi:hypothetical protein
VLALCVVCAPLRVSTRILLRHRGVLTQIRAVASGASPSDLRGAHFVLLGAAAAMGPLRSLLARGAHVTAVDLPSPRVGGALRPRTRIAGAGGDDALHPR